MRFDATALVENLASRGYVVVTIDQTHEAQLVDFGGRVVRGTFVDTAAAFNERAVKPRIADVGDGVVPSRPRWRRRAHSRRRRP